jgi:predicted nucleotidyltransferase
VLAALPRIGAALRDLGASRVWVFGSVLGEYFDEASDLDVAVEGLPPANFFPARVSVSAVCPIDFDLVELERAPEPLRAHILAEGQELCP